MTQQKERLRDLWKCHKNPTTPRRSRVERATKNACSGKVRILEIERSALKVQLAKIAYDFRDKRKPNIAIQMADLIVKIEDLDKQISELN